VTTVFLDTVGLIAVWDTADQWHAQAAAVFERLAKNRTRLVTTSFVLCECGNSAARKPYRNDVEEFRRELLRFGDLIAPLPEDEHSAWEAYREHHAARAGIVDQISFVVMQRLQIREAFTNDAHFRAAGFITLF